MTAALREVNGIVLGMKSPSAYLLLDIDDPRAKAVMYYPPELAERPGWFICDERGIRLHLRPFGSLHEAVTFAALHEGGYALSC